ncbi:hypothetical protein XA68_12879 [Ophiocordyceps unilateralis]|uniref:SET domain-containing protein n=1 Tax=Ophiocordyceps unilateralis TaxID=268505 RepID=A0A2A9PDH2_OPHUN|nr:hypothetical protein XA68_12879 [Ophiocordyceps unilateralis]
MDTKDVSDTESFKAYLDNIISLAERALRRKGQSVHDHPSPEEIIFGFMLTRARTFMCHFRDKSIAMSLVPAPYAACSRSFTELTPIMISDMRLETHHRGSKTLLRVCTPENRITAVMAIVEDEQGTAALLQLYYQPEETDVPVECILKPGHVCLVKEPYFKCANDGTYSIRVDHVSDIIWLENNDEKIPKEWRKASVPSNSSLSLSYRYQGNEAVGLQMYSSAIAAATTAEEEQIAYLNRSLANLKLDRPEKALSDAVHINAGSSPSEEKQLFREARALYELGKMESSRDSLQKLVQLFPNNTAAKEELNRATARLQEQQTGEYDFDLMYKQSKATPPLIDCATFSAPVEVRVSPGRGRGLFTKEAVSAGQLLLCEKAFAYAYAEEDDTAILVNQATRRMTVGGQARLLTQLVQKLYHNPQLSRPFMDLHHGDYAASAVLDCDGRPVVDSFMVERIMALNSFGAPRTSLESLAAVMTDEGERDKLARCTGFTTTGIWLLASHINHSCVANCRRSFIGDMQIVRATKDLPAGSELVFFYHPPLPYQSYKEAQAKLSPWGFTCDCELCQIGKATTGAALKRRKDLRSDLSKAMDHSVGAANAAGAKQVLKKMAKTYPAAGGSSVRLELWDPYFALGGALVSAGKPVAGVEMLVRGFEALGFDITARAPVSGKGTKLEVRRWGQACEWTPFAFFKLCKAFEVLAPELCAVAKTYFETAYIMVVGEGSTAKGFFKTINEETK